jgi:hypothetical protein
MRGMLFRAYMAARLDRATFRDVRRDPNAALNAVGIVILAGIAVTIGMSSAVGESVEAGLNGGEVGDRLLGAWFASVTLMVGWLIWAGMAYGVGWVFQRNNATFREILRVLGVCFGPGLLLIFTAIPQIEGLVFGIVALWMLVAGVAALKEIQQSDWIGAIMDGSLGWIIGIYILPRLLIENFFGAVSTAT